MNIEKIIDILISIYADQEGVEIKYTLERKEDSEIERQTA